MELKNHFHPLEEDHAKPASDEGYTMQSQTLIPIGDGSMSVVGTTPPGTCPECAVAHDIAQPHNRDSLAYQYKFFAVHGRWPTWADALAHCDENTKNWWVVALASKGIVVTFPDDATQSDNARDGAVNISNDK